MMSQDADALDLAREVKLAGRPGRFRIPATLPAVKARSAGVHPSASAAVTAGVSLARWAAVSRHPWPRVAKN
jgi:hypothetical protein